MIDGESVDREPRAVSSGGAGRNATGRSARTPASKRLGERKDTKIALEAARHHRAHAEMNGLPSTWAVRRGYPATTAVVGI